MLLAKYQNSSSLMIIFVQKVEKFKPFSIKHLACDHCRLAVKLQYAEILVEK